MLLKWAYFTNTTTYMLTNHILFSIDSAQWCWNATYVCVFVLQFFDSPLLSAITVWQDAGTCFTLWKRLISHNKLVIQVSAAALRCVCPHAATVSPRSYMEFAFDNANSDDGMIFLEPR